MTALAEARRLTAESLLILGLGLGGAGLWAATAPLDGAVIAAGWLETEGRRQVVDAAEGGAVAEIVAAEGSYVAAGDPILRLDDHDLVIEAEAAAAELRRTEARIARLSAEAAGRPCPLSSGPHRSLADDAAASDERALCQRRRAALATTAHQLAERGRETRVRIAGLERERDATWRQRQLLDDELARERHLLDRGLNQAARVGALEREAARLDGAMAALDAEIAGQRGALTGFEIEQLRGEEEFRAAAEAALAEARPQAASLAAQLRLLAIRKARMVLRAPVAGRVTGLAVTTPGATLAAGAEVAAVVPEAAQLVLRAAIDPSQVDRLYPGQPAVVQFPAIGTRRTPAVSGVLRYVSADTLTDRTTGQRAYAAEITLPADLAAQIGVRPLSGMPAVAFFRTGQRSALDYLIKPAADFFGRALRED